MSDHADGQRELTAYQFTVCLLAALTRRGYVAMWAPRSDRTHVTDVAAAATWEHLKQQPEGDFNYRFRVYTHPNYRYSGDWQEQLGECEAVGLITLLTPQAARSDKFWYRFEAEWLQSLAPEFPGSDELWDEVSSVFVEHIEAEEPFALAGAPLSW